MKKFLFILLLIPGLAALANDVYIYTENPEKGFRMMDLGALWDKYHKESHDQWKIKVNEFSDNVSNTVNTVKDSVKDMAPKDLMGTEDTPQATNDVETDDTPDYMKGFSQETNDKGDVIEGQVKTDEPKEVQKTKVVHAIGFLLEQKAVTVFFGFAIIIFLLNAILCKMFGKKEDTDGMQKIRQIKKKGKSGNYQYSRK